MSESCSRNLSNLSAILDREGLLVAAAVDLRTEKAEGFSPQALQGSGQRSKKSQDSCDFPDGILQNTLAKKKSYDNRTVCAWP